MFFRDQSDQRRGVFQSLGHWRNQISVLRWRLEKQPTNLAAARQSTCYFGDRTLGWRCCNASCAMASAAPAKLNRPMLNVTS